MLLLTLYALARTCNLYVVPLALLLESASGKGGTALVCPAQQFAPMIRTLSLQKIVSSLCAHLIINRILINPSKSLLQVPLTTMHAALEQRLMFDAVTLIQVQ
jgi:hypothetical protein